MKKLLPILGLFIAVNAFAGTDTNEPSVSLSKFPWAVGFGLKGTVTNIVADGDKIHFQFHGWFYLRQYSWNGVTNGQSLAQVIKMDCQRGISATVTVTDFVATVPNVNAAAVRTSEALLPIFKAAEAHGRELTISLLSPKLNFQGDPIIEDAKVWRISDWDLH
jgi:hypothetical protein